MELLLDALCAGDAFARLRSQGQLEHFLDSLKGFFSILLRGDPEDLETVLSAWTERQWSPAGGYFVSWALSSAAFAPRDKTTAPLLLALSAVRTAGRLEQSRLRLAAQAHMVRLLGAAYHWDEASLEALARSLPKSLRQPTLSHWEGFEGRPSETDKDTEDPPQTSHPAPNDEGELISALSAARGWAQLEPLFHAAASLLRISTDPGPLLAALSSVAWEQRGEGLPAAVAALAEAAAGRLDCGAGRGVLESFLALGKGFAPLAELAAKALAARLAQSAPDSEELCDLAVRFCLEGDPSLGLGSGTNEALEHWAEASGLSGQLRFVESSPHVAPRLARIHGLSAMLSLARSSGANRRRIWAQLDALPSGPAAGKGASLAHGPHHRRSTRTVSAALLLTDTLTAQDEDLQRAMLNSFLERLCDENMQHSFRLLSEMLLARLVLRQPTLWPELLGWEAGMRERRAGSVASFAGVLLHVALAAEEGGELWERTKIRPLLPLLLPWIGAQNFAVRCTAQAALRTLCERRPGWLGDGDECLQALVRAATDDKLENTRGLNHAGRLASDWYFRRLSVAEDFDLETLFHSLPRLTGLPKDECLTKELFRKAGVDLGVRLEARSSLSAADLDASAWLGKKRGAGEPHLLEWRSGGGEVQRKLVPLAHLQEELGLARPSHDADSEKAPKLILVASLVEKAANLGGLCRTAEALGASELVLASLAKAQEADFKALAVSADRWITLSETKPSDLPALLVRKRSEGFDIVGVEQTSQSRPLNDFAFPKRCVVVLGRERSGLPAELIPLMGSCVEIPQAGRVRSLNVHVSGALILWAWASQHRI